MWRLLLGTMGVKKLRPSRSKAKQSKPRLTLQEHYHLLFLLAQTSTPWRQTSTVGTSCVARQWLWLWHWQSLRCAHASQTYSSLSQPGQSPPAAARETSVPSNDWKPSPQHNVTDPPSWTGPPPCAGHQTKQDKEKVLERFLHRHARSIIFFKPMTPSLTLTN